MKNMSMLLCKSADHGYWVTKQPTLLVSQTAHIFMSCKKGQHYSMLWLVKCLDFVFWSGTFSHVTMFGHVAKCGFLIDCKRLTGNCLSICVLKLFLY